MTLVRKLRIQRSFQRHKILFALSDIF